MGLLKNWNGECHVHNVWVAVCLAPLKRELMRWCINSPWLSSPAPAISRTRPCSQLRRGRELTYDLRLRLPTKRLYSRTMTATTRRRLINPPPIWKANKPSNQSTTRIMTIAQRIVPNITRTPFTNAWEQRGRHSLRGKKQFLPYLYNETCASLVIWRSQLRVGSEEEINNVFLLSRVMYKAV